MLYYSSCFPSFAFLLLVIGRICYPSDLLEKSLLLFLPVSWNALESHFQKTNSHLCLSVSAFLPFWFGEKIFSFRIFLFLFVSEVHNTWIKVQILCICIQESCMFSSRLADINRMPVMVSGKYCSGWK